MTTLEPEYHRHEEFINRSQKLEEIKELGIDPFPPKFSPTAMPGQIAQTYEGQEIGHSEDAQQGSTPSVAVAGRLVLFRAMGKNAFAHIQDETGRVQIMFNRDETQSSVTLLRPRCLRLNLSRKKSIWATSSGSRATSSARKKEK